MFAQFSKRLSATVAMALVTGLFSMPAIADYSGRTAGSHPQPVPGVKNAHVNLYSGGSGRRLGGSAWPQSDPRVTIYRGGQWSYAAYTREPEYIDALEVVIVTRGGGPQARMVHAQCIAPDGHEMPAARVTRANAGAESGSRELFRCEDSFTLHAFVGGPGARASGPDVICKRDQSLWSSRDHTPLCRPKNRLAYSEAELRHANGTGPVEMMGPRQNDHPSVIVTRGMSLSGGVGYAPY